MSSSMGSKSSNSSGRRERCREELKRTALGSAWIRRLRLPETTITRSHVTSTVPAPLHLKSCFALHFLPKNSSLLPLPPPPSPPSPPPPPSLPPPRHEIVRSSELAAGFGPFRFRAPDSHARALCSDGRAAGVSPFFQYRRQLATGILGNNEGSRFQSNLGPAHELIDGSPSPLRVKGSASRDVASDHPAASRNVYNPHAFNINTVRHLSERQSYCFSSEPEEPFSYWNMGRPEGRNFVSSACPVSSSTVAPKRKRTANTYGFISSKFARFCREG